MVKLIYGIAYVSPLIRLTAIDDDANPSIRPEDLIRYRDDTIMIFAIKHVRQSGDCDPKIESAREVWTAITSSGDTGTVDRIFSRCLVTYRTNRIEPGLCRRSVHFDCFSHAVPHRTSGRYAGRDPEYFRRRGVSIDVPPMMALIS